MRFSHHVDEDEKTEASIIIPLDQEEKSFHLYVDPPSLKPIMGATK